MSDPATASFEAIVERLEAIAGKLEAGEVPLEQALALFEEGVTLSKQGTRRLDDAEKRLEVLLSQGHTQPLEPPQAELALPPGANGPTGQGR